MLTANLQERDSTTGGDTGGSGMLAGAVVSDMVVVLLVIVAVVGAATGRPMVAALCALVFAIALVARLWARLSLVDVTYACLPSTGRLIEGDELDLAIVVENRKPLPIPWLDLQDVLPAGLRLVGGGREEHTFTGATELRKTTSLGRYQRVTLRHKVTAARRGHYTFGPAQLDSGDLFGFYQSRKILRHRGPDLIVYPRTVTLPAFSLPSARPIGAALSAVPLVDDPTRPQGVREYQPGDPMRRIDWKTTARRGAPFVRTYDPSMSQCAVVLLECDTADPTRWGDRPEAIETAVTAAASVAMRSLELGYHVGLIANGITPGDRSRAVIPPGRGPDQLPELMASLATVHALPPRTLEELAQEFGASAIPFGATLVYVAGLLHPDTVEFMRRKARRGHRVATVYIGSADPPDLPGMGLWDARTTFARPAAGDPAAEDPAAGDPAAGDPVDE